MGAVNFAGLLSALRETVRNGFIVAAESDLFRET